MRRLVLARLPVRTLPVTSHFYCQHTCLPSVLSSVVFSRPTRRYFCQKSEVSEQTNKEESSIENDAHKQPQNTETNANMDSRFANTTNFGPVNSHLILEQSPFRFGGGSANLLRRLLNWIINLACLLALGFGLRMKYFQNYEYPRYERKSVEQLITVIYQQCFERDIQLRSLLGTDELELILDDIRWNFSNEEAQSDAQDQKHNLEAKNDGGEYCTLTFHVARRPGASVSGDSSSHMAQVTVRLTESVTDRPVGSAADPSDRFYTYTVLCIDQVKMVTDTGISAVSRQPRYIEGSISKAFGSEHTRIDFGD